MLYGCFRCKENSVVRKIYTTRQGETKRVEYCINKGCGYRKDLTIARYLVAVLTMICIGLCGLAESRAENIRINESIYINMNTIKQIESSNNPRAYNKRSKARGLYQITEIVLIEYNNFNKTTYTTSDLFNPTINYTIAKWYMGARIPDMLRYFNKPITINNLLISYNAGINYVVKGLPLPTETKNYIEKYNNLNKKGV